MSNESGKEFGTKIKFTVSVINSSDSKTDVYLATSSFVSQDTQLSIRMAKNVVCSIFNCKGKDFLVKIYSDTPVLSGPSGGAAFATGMAMALLGLKDKDVGITGTINPGGVIGPVGGVNYKVEAARDLDMVIIPLGEKIYKDPLTGKVYNLSFPNVREAGTLFDILRYIWNVNVTLKNNEFKVPVWYKRDMKEIANSICSLINKRVVDNLSYYAQASKCFSQLIKIYQKEYENLNLNEVAAESKKLQEELEQIKRNLKKEFKTINGLNQLQLYMILYKRINDAEDSLKKIDEELKNYLTTGQINVDNIIYNLAYAKARILSIKEWAKFLNNMPKGKEINVNNLVYLCNEDYKQAEMYYNYLIGLYESYKIPFNFKFLDDTFKKMEYYKNKDYILCIAYAKDLKSSIDTMLSLTYLTKDSLPYFFNSTSKVADFYIKRNKEFPVMAYAYWNYAKYLAEKDKDYTSAISYNYYAINLATMIYEINREEVPVLVKINYNENNNSLIYLAVILSFVAFFLLTSKVV